MPRARPFAAALVLSLSSPAAAAPRREPPLLLGGPRARTRPSVPVDPALPTGARVSSAARPEGLRARYCSFRRPVCVHVPEAAREAATLALGALESAYERVVLGLGLPQPAPDALGGSDALDAYVGPPDSELLVDADAPLSGPFARAAGFCHLPASDAALLLRSAVLCVGEAIALGLDASEPPHLRRAFATSLWWKVGLPTSLDFEAIDAVQAHPEAPVATRELDPSSEGAALFFTYLEAARSEAEPGELSAALFSAAASAPARTSLDYVNEPDLFDVLRHSLDEEEARFAALMVDFAVARAFVGERDDGLHLPELAWTGRFGRVRFDWVVPFSTLPRRVAIQPPVDSTGAAFVWLDLDDVALGASLGFQAEWEAPVAFHWQLVKLAANGEEIGRIDVPFQERGRSAEARVTNLGDAAAVLLIGTNLEGVSLAHPFDPDVAPFEPHGVSIYLVRL